MVRFMFQRRSPSDRLGMSSVAIVTLASRTILPQVLMRLSQLVGQRRSRFTVHDSSANEK